MEEQIYECILEPGNVTYMWKNVNQFVGIRLKCLKHLIKNIPSEECWNLYVEVNLGQKLDKSWVAVNKNVHFRTINIKN